MVHDGGGDGSSTRAQLPSGSPWRLGYFGHTSHTNVLAETESCLALLGKRSQPIEEEVVQRGPSFRDLPLPLREACFLVLRCLPGQRNEQMRFGDHYCERQGWAYIAVDRIIRSLQTTFGDILSDGDAGLEMMAKILCSNSRRAMLDHADPQEWLDQFCGRNIRWESIGLLWVHLMHISDMLDSLHSRSLEWIEGKESLETAAACLAYCIDLSRCFTDGNDLLLDLCRRRSTLLCMVGGYAREFHGLMLTSLTTL